MTDKELRYANEIKKEINELESFIFTAERVWTGKIIKRKAKYIFKADGYGAFNSKEYEMNTEMKNRVLEVLKDRLVELKNKLSEI